MPRHDSLAGRWDHWYTNPQDTPAIGSAEPGPQPLARTITYQIGASWLADCESVEDWGCGLGWLRSLVPPERYRGIDGSRSPYADEVADLVEYRSSVPGIFMRHVLEHNYEWAQILDNAIASFTKRMALILFTPMGNVTRQISFLPAMGVPDISFRHEDIVDRLEPTIRWSCKDYETRTAYGCERVYFLERGGTPA